MQGIGCRPLAFQNAWIQSMSRSATGHLHGVQTGNGRDWTPRTAELCSLSSEGCLTTASLNCPMQPARYGRG